MLDYGLIHTWYSHTTHKSNVQWISISFCDFPCLNVMCVCSIPWWSNPKRFLSVLFVLGSDFCYSCFKSFSQNVNFFFFFGVEKLGVWLFRDSLHEWMHSHPRHEVIWENFNFLTISGSESCNSFTSASQLRPDPWIFALCICTFRE